MVSLSLSFPQKLALFTQKSYSPTNLSNIYFSPTTVNSKQKDVTGPPHSLMLGGGCQDMLRWSGQNANQKVGPDKMPTTEKKSRTKCQPRLAFCPVGISPGWHFVHTPNCWTFILSLDPHSSLLSRWYFEQYSHCQFQINSVFELLNWSTIVFSPYMLDACAGHWQRKKLCQKSVNDVSWRLVSPPLSVQCQFTGRGRGR